MKGANQEFMKEKERWLRNHMIFYNVTGGTGVGAASGVYEFDLRALPGIRDGQGRTVKAYELTALRQNVEVGKKTYTRDVDSRTHAIRAHFLPWSQNQTFSMGLNNNADFFFTPTLNGCSFAAETGANPRVTHSNYVDNTPAQRIDQARIDAAIIARHGGPVAGVLRKNDYKPVLAPGAGTVDYKVTIVGFRKATGWEFYYQRYEQSLNAGNIVNIAMDRLVRLV